MPDELTVPEDESMESRIRPATEEELPEPIVMEPEDEDFEPIRLVEEEDAEADHAKRVVKQSARSNLVGKHIDFKRPLNVTGNGATRCRIFHSRIALESLDNMEARINDWLDADEIEVKDVGHVLGVMEGKSPKPNLMVVVWY